MLTTVSYTADVGAQMVEILDGAGTPAPIEDADSADGHQVGLAMGAATVINVRVTAESHTVSDPAQETYKITVYRDTAASSDATLQSLSLSGLTLMPAFDSATTMYTAEVDALDMTMVEAMAAHPGATVEGTGEMSLTAGENVISVTVTAEDETSQTYTVTVTVLMGETIRDRYDADDSGHIDRSEAVQAVIDFQAGLITRDEAVEVILLYQQGN